MTHDRPTHLYRTLTWFFLASLALRFLFWFVVVRSGTSTLHDEGNYFVRAAAFAQIFSGLLRFELPAGELWSGAYGEGRWPPLHPMVLGSGLVLGGSKVAVARLVMVLVSALTTPLVYRLTLELASPRAAAAAASLHLAYPTFIAYSHYLWSETTAIFLLLAAVLATVKAADSPRTLTLAAGAGVLYGLGTLTRAAALPFVLVVPLWLAYVRRERRLAGYALAAALAVLLPWQTVLLSREGRFVPISTMGGYNLALGNHAGVPLGYGSSWGHDTSKKQLHRALNEVGERESVGWGAAGYTVALEELRRRPGTSLLRGLARLRMLWAPDHFPLRHLFNAVYPPVSALGAQGFLAIVVAGYLILVVLSVLGLASRRGLSHRGLLSLLLAAGMLPAAVTLANSRLHLPLLALLLPAAGHGLSLLLPGAPYRPRPGVVAVALLVALAAGTSLPRVVGLYLVPSSHHAAAVHRLDRLLGSETAFSDRIVLRRTEAVRGELTVRVLSPGFRFPGGIRERLWPAAEPRLVLDVFSDEAGEPLEIEIASPSSGAATRVRPIAQDAWRKPQPAGIEGVEVRWTGGGRSPR